MWRPRASSGQALVSDGLSEGSVATRGALGDELPPDVPLDDAPR